MNKVMLLLVALCIGPAALAADDPMSHKYFVMVGGFWPDVDTTVRVDGNGGRIGTKLDFESDLGLDDRDALFTAGAGWRIAERHYLDLLYFKLARSGDHTIDIDINFRDQTFTRQSDLNSFFNTEVYRISYGYAFIQNDKHLLLGQVGAHWTKVSAGVRLEGNREVSGDASSSVPLPVFGLAYDYMITPKLRLDLRAQIFRLSFEGIDGSIDNLSASLAYGFTPSLGAFLGYNYYSIDVDADRDNWNGSFSFGYKGPWLGVMWGFGSL
ncbi:MAG TPA: hypothetical protein VKB34_18520 [Povalibacter sp.]|nr:hypothetical protein [Povalibacter sp.]